jgi:hypothetical protein
VVVVLLLLGLEHMSFIFLVSFSFLFGCTVLPLGYCVVAESMPFGQKIYFMVNLLILIQYCYCPYFLCIHLVKLKNIDF